ncbi:MAG: glycosyltransferase, partial [Myxococcota bacterium]
MRLLFSSTSGAGHLGPLLPLARECVARGHEVTFASTERAAAAVAKHGVPFRAFGDGDAAKRGAVFATNATRSVEASNERVVREVFGRINTGAALPGMRALVRELQPELILRDPCEAASWIAATEAGIPTALVSCLLERSMAFLNEHLVAGLRPFAQKLGVALAADVHQGSEAVVIGAPAHLDGDWEGARVLRAAPPHEAAPPARDGSVPEVLVCLGTVTGFLPGLLGSIGPAICEALGERPLRAVFAVGRGVDARALGPVPSNVEVVDFAPFAEVLPRCSLALVHGGHGTTLGVLAHGVPMVLTPLFSYDQFDLSQAVVDAGAGLRLPGPPSAAQIGVAIDAALANGTLAERAEALG